MKTLSLITATLFLVLVSCKKDEKTKPDNKGDITSQINAFPNEPLNADELASLITMREEEKLAYDVYITLYNKWGTTIFSNIASSEQLHTNAVATLLSKYNLTDPATAYTIGVFKDSTLQLIYNDLIAKGNTSLLNAFIVGATIEDLDISDLNAWSSKCDNQDIQFAFQNLTKGSRNHMRSFYSQLKSAGGSYSAQYISQTELDAILNNPKETGSW